MAIIVIVPATIAYFNLDLTTPGMSTPWEVAETIVVSEIGARLSPKAAPEMITPASNAGLAPRAIPAGYRTAIPAAIVPKPVPEAVAKTAEAMKDITTKKVPLIPIEAESPAIPPASPEDLKILEKTPANIQHTIGIIASLLAIPSIRVSA